MTRPDPTAADNAASVPVAKWHNGGDMADPDRHHHDGAEGRMTHTHLDGKYSHSHPMAVSAPAGVGDHPPIDTSDEFTIGLRLLPSQDEADPVIGFVPPPAESVSSVPEQ